MKFKRIYVEICNTCNLSCSFCASRPAHPRQMSVKQFADIVEQVRPYTDHLYLHLLGEPLMHPQLEAILQICQRASLHVQLTTNGTLLASRRELLEAYPPRQINISVHSFWEQPRDLCANYLEQVLTCGDALSAHSYISYRLWQVEEGEDPKTQTLLRAICAHYEMPLPERLQGSLRMDRKCWAMCLRNVLRISWKSRILSCCARGCNRDCCALRCVSAVRIDSDLTRQKTAEQDKDRPQAGMICDLAVVSVF